MCAALAEQFDRLFAGDDYICKCPCGFKLVSRHDLEIWGAVVQQPMPHRQVILGAIPGRDQAVSRIPQQIMLEDVFLLAGVSAVGAWESQLSHDQQTQPLLNGLFSQYRRHRQVQVGALAHKSAHRRLDPAHPEHAPRDRGQHGRRPRQARQVAQAGLEHGGQRFGGLGVQPRQGFIQHSLAVIFAGLQQHAHDLFQEIRVAARITHQRREHMLGQRGQAWVSAGDRFGDDRQRPQRNYLAQVSNLALPCRAVKELRVRAGQDEQRHHLFRWILQQE